MTPRDLYHQVTDALSIVGNPEWPSAEAPDRLERLVFLSEAEESEPCWAIISEGASGEFENNHEGPSGVHDELGEASTMGDAGHERGCVDGCCGHDHSHGAEEEADWVAWQVEVEVAMRIVADHLRRCLAATGWQVQLSIIGGTRRWRLADCLSFSDGGGDRLEGEYPFGADELTILCASILAVQSARVPRLV